jgi:hypothetical protein
MKDDEQSNVIVEYKNISKFFKPKPFTVHTGSKFAEITKYVEVTIYELY